MMDQRELSYRARGLRDLTEPLAASVYFAPECHSNYERVGFGPSPGGLRGVAGPNFEAYFVSRGACLGGVPGEVVTAAFGVFESRARRTNRGLGLVESGARSAARRPARWAVARRTL